MPLILNAVKGACVRQSVFEYRRREPEQSVLHEAIRVHLSTFLATHSVPSHVERAFRNYVDCGCLAKGFLRVRCPECKKESLVAFSCKDRGFCPSCTARRAADTAAHLVDNVLPHAPMRQWVLALPMDAHLRVSRDAELETKLLNIFHEELEELLRATSQAGELSQGGSVTFIQHFGSTLNVHVHFHLLALDGLYVPGANDEAPPTFTRAPAPTREQVTWLCERIATRARRVLARAPVEEPTDERQAPVLRVHDTAPAELHEPKLHARVDGFDLHASQPIEALDRTAVERFIRYCLRGPIAEGRLTNGPREGLLTYRLKEPKADGTTSLVLSPIALLERLAKLIPLPGRHMVRHHGVLSNAARWRPKILPKPPDDPTIQLPGLGRRRRLDWANLLRRVYLIDVLACSCGARRQIIATIEEGPVATRILRHLGLPYTAPKLEPARIEQPELWPTGPPPLPDREPPPAFDWDQRPPTAHAEPVAPT